MKAPATIPSGTSFVQWTQQLNEARGTALEPQVLAKQLGLSLSDAQLSQAFDRDVAVDLAAVPRADGATFASRQAQRGTNKPGSVFNVQSAQKGEQLEIIRGPLNGYRVTDAAQAEVAIGAVTRQDVIAASTAAGASINAKVELAVSTALADQHLTMEELTGGAFAKLLAHLGLHVGPSIATAMERDTLLQTSKIDPNDYRMFNDLLRRADLPEGAPGRIMLGDGVRAELGGSVRELQQQMLEGAKTSAFIEKVDGTHLVNQTAMTMAPVDTEMFFANLPPEYWAEDCFDLRSIHTDILERRPTADGGYEQMMIQRMEFGDDPMATDMTKLTQTKKWKDDDGQWHATSSWKVYASDPTEQIDHAGSMLIDQGRMEFAPVNIDGKRCTEITFNNQTQTNTELEKKLMDWALRKDSPVRGRISAELASSDLMGIHAFAGKVVERYAAVGSGEVPARWPSLAQTHITGS